MHKQTPTVWVNIQTAVISTRASLGSLKYAIVLGITGRLDLDDSNKL